MKGKKVGVSRTLFHPKSGWNKGGKGQRGGGGGL
jgi:hypothetical protein